MPDLIVRLENFIIEVTDCEMTAKVADTTAKQDALKLRVDYLRKTAGEIRQELFGYTAHEDVDFLTRLAKEFRQLALTCKVEAIRTELYAMAAAMDGIGGSEARH